MDKTTEINNKGVEHFLNNNFVDAENEYNKALELDAENTTTLNNLGLLYHKKKDFEKAEECFKKAISLKKKDTYLLNLANAQVFLKKMNEAENNYKEAIQLNEQNKSAKISLARFYEAQNRINESVKIWTALVKTQSDDFYKIELAKNFMALEKFELALEILNNTISETGEILCFMGVCEFNLKNFGMAEDAFKRSLANQPNNFKTRHYLAINYLSKGDYKNAIKELDFIIRLNPENEKVTLDKVSILLNLQKYNDANYLLDEILQKFPKSRKAHKYKELVVELLKED